MNLPITIISLLTLMAILVGPFLIQGNAVAQALFGVITTAIATSVGVWASWKYSRSSDKERLTRYGLLAWRNIDALSVKLRQQIQHGSARAEVLESWLLDIDGAKWAWKDLLREVFELQQRLTLETEEVSLEYKNKISAATSESEKEKLINEFKVALARIRNRAPLPIDEKETVSCPNCGADVNSNLGTEVGATAWPSCDGCGALFPIHRKSGGEVTVNSDALKLPVTKECPSCKAALSWKVSATKPVHFIYRCPSCEAQLQCDGTATAFTVKKAADA